MRWRERKRERDVHICIYIHIYMYRHVHIYIAPWPTRAPIITNDYFSYAFFRTEYSDRKKYDRGLLGNFVHAFARKSFFAFFFFAPPSLSFFFFDFSPACKIAWTFGMNGKLVYLFTIHHGGGKKRRGREIYRTYRIL